MVSSNLVDLNTSFMARIYTVLPSQSSFPYSTFISTFIQLTASSPLGWSIDISNLTCLKLNLFPLLETCTACLFPSQVITNLFFHYLKPNALELHFILLAYMTLLLDSFLPNSTYTQNLTTHFYYWHTSLCHHPLTLQLLQ